MAHAGWESWRVLFSVVLATVILTELITTAAVLLFPIAVTAAAQVNADPRPFALAVAITASASFLTPIGYRTKTIVYGLGGYRFTDFARLGLLLALVVPVIALVFVPLFWPL